jgi:hypothetical protein
VWTSLQPLFEFCSTTKSTAMHACIYLSTFFVVVASKKEQAKCRTKTVCSPMLGVSICVCVTVHRVGHARGGQDRESKVIKKHPFTVPRASNLVSYDVCADRCRLLCAGWGSRSGKRCLRVCSPIADCLNLCVHGRAQGGARVLGAAGVAGGPRAQAGPTGIIEVRDCVLLNGYTEPVLLILHQPDPTWPGRYKCVRPTFCWLLYSLAWELQVGAPSFLDVGSGVTQVVGSWLL